MNDRWATLGEELDAWAEADRCATLWWRDDDAAEPSDALDNLLALAREARVPLALAVIPETTGEALARRVGAEDARHIAVLQHGIAHRNHAPAAAKKAELGAHRPAADTLADLKRSHDKLAALFDARLAPILVPPWNRIDPGLLPHLPALEFRAVSTYSARARALAAPGLAQANCHIDIINWRGGRGFVGEDAALDLAIEHLSARRTGRADAEEPTGLLTHHLVHDPACWRFLREFLLFSRAHSGARWVNIATSLETLL